MSVLAGLADGRKLRDVVSTIYDAVLHLPKPVRRVCIVSCDLWLGLTPGTNSRIHGLVSVSVLLDNVCG